VIGSQPILDVLGVLLLGLLRNPDQPLWASAVKPANHGSTNTFDMQDLMRSVLDDLARLPRVSRVNLPVRDPMTDLLD